MLKIGVTGTDTAVGKTVVTSALVSVLRSRGLRTAVMKPVETGVVRGEPGSDHMLLAAAAGITGETTDVCPVIMEESLAPWVAAAAAKTEIDIGKLDVAFQRLARDADCILVEGAGGLLVPITRTVRFDHLFQSWELELVIVASDRLGVINHSLLTVDAAHNAGLKVRGIVVNQVHRSIPTSVGMRNAEVLRELLPEIPIVEFPCVEGLHGIRRLRESPEPFDIGLLRDVALGAGLANLFLEPSVAGNSREG